MKRRAPTRDEVKVLRALLASLDVKGRELETGLVAVEVPKHGLLLEPGGDPGDSGVVMTGVVREFYLQPDGTEHTRGFALPGDSFGSLADALMKRPSRVFVRAETSATVLLVKWARIAQLATTSLEWERLQAKLVQRLYLKKSVREFELLALDAMGRYQSLRAQYPSLETLVSGQLIATYLGITNVHLSRLRRRLKA